MKGITKFSYKEMNKNIKDILINFDDPIECEYPKTFNYLIEMEEVKKIKDNLKTYIKLDLDDQIQDASFFADLYILDKHELKNKITGKSYVLTYDICIRFSCYGKMVTIFSNSDNK